MDGTACIHFFNLPLEHFGALNGRACRRNARHEHVGSIRLENFPDPPPMCHLKRCDGGTDGDRVKPKETMAEHDWMLWGQICADQMRRRREENDEGCTTCHVHFLWIRDCSSSTVGPRSSSLSRRSTSSLLSLWNRHHEGVADELNRALGDGREGKEARDVCLEGRAEEPLLWLRSERRASNEERSGGECWRNIGAPGDWGSTKG